MLEKTTKPTFRKGDPLVSSGFVGYVKKVKKNVRGTLCTKFALAGLGQSTSLVVLVVSVKSGPISVRSVV